MKRSRIPIAVGLVLSTSAASAQMTRQEALSLVYPRAAIHAEQIFLTEGQQQSIARSGVDIPSRLVARYTAILDGVPVGRAYVDTHIVRTKKESLLISLDERGRVKRIDTTAFLEPAEYMASEQWLRQYRDQELRDDLELNRAIRPLGGATLTARAVNAAVRRVLAIDRVLREDAR